MKKCFLFAMLCLFAVPAFAQNFTTIVATNIQDVSGAKLASGALCFDASNATSSANDTPSNEISIQAGGGGQVIRGPICTPITTGAIGTFSVPNSANTIPAGVVYHVYVIQGSFHVLDYYQVSVTGSSWDFDTYNPTTPVGAVPSGNTVNGPFTVNGNLTWTGTGTGDLTLTSNGNGALKPVAADAVRFVSSSGSDSNDGLSRGSAFLTMSHAYSSLPNCTVYGVKGGSAKTFACGTIYAAAGVLAQSSTLTVSSPLVRIVGGQGGGATQIQYTGTGCAIVINGSATSGNQFQGALLSNLSIDGSNDTNTNACGIETIDLANATLQNVSVGNFTEAGDAGVISTAASYFNERVNLDRVYIGNCTIGWLLSTPTIAGQSETTLGYGWANVYINVEANQVGIESEGTSSSAAEVSQETMHAVINLDASTATCINLIYSKWFYDLGTVDCDGGGKDIVSDANSVFDFGGSFVELSGLGNTVPSGAFVEYNSITGFPGNDYQLNIETCAGGTCGYTGVSFPTSGSQTITLPSSAGTLALAGANGVSAGTVTLASGAGSHTFSTAYSSAPVCTATDTTSAAAVKATSSTTAVTLAGTGTDVIAWVCTPAAN